jgi:predicted RNA-binding Zn ribbon-like protein
MSPAGAQSPAQQAGSAHAALLTVTNVAAQLGIKVSSRASEDLAVGTSITGTLVQPDTIAKLGVRGMHDGARVTVSRMAPDRLRVEADEMEPLPAKVTVNLRIGDDGKLHTMPKP